MNQTPLIAEGECQIYWSYECQDIEIDGKSLLTLMSEHFDGPTKKDVIGHWDILGKMRITVEPLTEA